MEVRHQAVNGAVLAPLPEMGAAIARQLDQEQQAWLQCLLTDPHQFGDVEVAVHETFQGLADQVVASLLAEISRRGALETPSKKSR
jgi:hypothetical protein